MNSTMESIFYCNYRTNMARRGGGGGGSWQIGLSGKFLRVRSSTETLTEVSDSLALY